MASRVSTRERNPSEADEPERKQKDKLGHRRVDADGVVTFKRKKTDELMATIQMAITQSFHELAKLRERDILMQDFEVIWAEEFPSDGVLTGPNPKPAHKFPSFRFKTYAPVAFRYFRRTYRISHEHFFSSMCVHPMRELSNPGASGSIFYLSYDDHYIIKTVQHDENRFLQKLLPGYFLNLNQNPKTLLPKFYGLYCYQSGGKNIRFVVMNNLIPSSVKLHEKYDLKGSTFKRFASDKEKRKKLPTQKDVDFMNNHPDGLKIDPDHYEALMNTLEKDTRVLESFKIMDYSLLLGIHNMDQAKLEYEQEDADIVRDATAAVGVAAATAAAVSASPASAAPGEEQGTGAVDLSQSFRHRPAHSLPLESILSEHSTPVADNLDITSGGIPARNAKGERLILYVGIIDILQNYRVRKKLEHAFKAIAHDGKTISVCKPKYYSARFNNFMRNVVFKSTQSLDHPHLVRFRKLVRLAMQQRTPRKSRAAGGATTVARKSMVSTGGGGGGGTPLTALSASGGGAGAAGQQQQQPDVVAGICDSIIGSDSLASRTSLVSPNDNADQQPSTSGQQTFTATGTISELTADITTTSGFSSSQPVSSSASEEAVRPKSQPISVRFSGLDEANVPSSDSEEDCVGEATDPSDVQLDVD